ncbi:hypothetical protein Cni_G27726 [Canna indica]|uniref:Glycosyltransferase n=1 Tax=Canna indica TaxID=4628 RepID=A0AAQ3QPL2_9LILI|nr:hypothetical protein Cni_G27726 [Canna indica]
MSKFKICHFRQRRLPYRERRFPRAHRLCFLPRPPNSQLIKRPMASASGRSSPHFVLIPWPAQGHMLPMSDIGRMLATHGATVTLITSPVNAARLRATVDRLAASGLRIRFVPLRFPAAEAGLPEGCETLDAIPSRDLIVNFFAAFRLLKRPLIDYLRAHSPSPSCFITGAGQAWTDEVAREFNAPRFVFNGYSCLSLLAIENLFRHKTHELVSSLTEPFALPGLPHRIEIARSQLPRHFQNDPRFEKMVKEVRDADLSSDGFVVNSFDELEVGYAESLAKATGKKVWMIGPVALCNQARPDMASRGNTAAVDEEDCLRWLNSQQPRSVIYVSFGSMASFSPPQLMELGAGLLSSNRPFVWVVKVGSSWTEEMEAWVAERIEGNSKCLLIKGWAPQLMMLSNPAIGGFLTHCGWNSTLEGVSAGVPMITWPLFSEQFLNEKLSVEVLGIGVSLGVQKPTEWLKVEEDGVVVGREEVAEAVERLMGGGEGRRRRANVLREKARRAVEEGGSSYLNMETMIQYVAERVC